MKSLLVLTMGVFESIPFTITLVFIVLGLGTYVVIDYYVIDLSPAVIIHDRHVLLDIQQKVTQMDDYCMVHHVDFKEK